MFGIEMKFGDNWHALDGALFASRDDAHWAIGRWRADHKHADDQTFRVVPLTA